MTTLGKSISITIIIVVIVIIDIIIVLFQALIYAVSIGSGKF